MPIDPNTRIGHIHLTVSDLDRALAFYRDILGFEVTSRYGRDAVFLAAGGYHHHIGLNTWAGRGAPAPAAGTTGASPCRPTRWTSIRCWLKPTKAALVRSFAFHDQTVADPHGLHRRRCRLVAPRNHPREVRELIGRHRHNGGRLHQVRRDGHVVGVGLRVVRVAIAPLELVEVEPGHAIREEREVVGPRLVPVDYRIDAEARHRREHGAPQTFQVRPPLQRLPCDRPGAVVEHDDCLDRVGLRGVRLRVLARPDQALLFPREEDEPDGALRLQARPGHDPGRLQGAHGAGAVVRGPGPEVPGVEVRADDDHLTRMLAAADLGDGVPLRHGITSDRVRDAYRELRPRARLEQAIDQGIVLMCDGDLRSEE